MHCSNSRVPREMFGGEPCECVGRVVVRVVGHTGSYVCGLWPFDGVGKRP